MFTPLYFALIYNIFCSDHIFSAGCTGTEIRSSEDLTDILLDVHEKNIKKKGFKLSEYNALKLRFAFGRRDADSKQEPLTRDDLLVTDQDRIFSQKEPDSPANDINNAAKKYESQTNPTEISIVLNQWYDDNNENNPLFHGFYFQMKQAIKKAYLHASSPINTKLRNALRDCIRYDSYPKLSDFADLFRQPHVKVS